VPQLQTALPTLLAQPLADRTSLGPVQVVAQDDARLGFLPVVRRCLPAGGVPPVATGPHQFDTCSGYGAVAPPPGASGFLALPCLNRRAFQRGLDEFAAALPESLPILALDNSAGHKAQAVRWPSNVVPVFWPPSSPDLKPMEWLWRVLKDQRADVSTPTIAVWSDALGTSIQRYAAATLPSWTRLTYFVQAAETVQKGPYG
jgi:hypothetical protein